MLLIKLLVSANILTALFTSQAHHHTYSRMVDKEKNQRTAVVTPSQGPDLSLKE